VGAEQSALDAAAAQTVSNSLANAPKLIPPMPIAHGIALNDVIPDFVQLPPVTSFTFPVYFSPVTNLAVCQTNYAQATTNLGDWSNAQMVDCWRSDQPKTSLTVSNNGGQMFIRVMTTPLSAWTPY
jgi:hypothetical protein